MPTTLINRYDNKEFFARRTYEDQNGQSLELTVENDTVTAIGGKAIGGSGPSTYEIPTGFIEGMRFQINGGWFELEDGSDENNTTPSFGGSWSSGDPGEVEFDADAGSIYEVSFDMTVEVREVTENADISNYTVVIKKSAQDDEWEEIKSYTFTVDELNQGIYTMSSRCFVKFTDDNLVQSTNKYILKFSPDYSEASYDASRITWKVCNVLIKKIA